MPPSPLSGVAGQKMQAALRREAEGILFNTFELFHYLPMYYWIFTKSSELNRQKAMLNNDIIGKSLKKFEKVPKKQ